MSYKLIEISKTVEKESQSIYDKENLSDAVNTMHNDFGVAVKVDANIGVYCVVINNDNGVKEDKLQWGQSVKDRVYTHNNAQEDNISSYDSEKLAIGNYHTKLSSQRNNPSVNFAITIRINGLGDIEDANIWNRTTE